MPNAHHLAMEFPEFPIIDRGIVIKTMNETLIEENHEKILKASFLALFKLQKITGLSNWHNC